MEPIKYTILAVDDDPLIRGLMEEIFSPESTTFLAAGTLAEAYKLLEEHLPDIILLDRDLPDGDGVELCRKVRENPERAEVPILMLTGRGTVGDKVLGLKVGADDYLAKPFHVDELEARIVALLRRRKK